MVLPFALWGTAMAAMAPLVSSGGVETVASLRLLPAGVALLIAVPLLGRSWTIASDDWVWFLIFTVIDASLFQFFLVRGLAETGAGLGSVLIDSQPLMVALLARSLFGDLINPIVNLYTARGPEGLRWSSGPPGPPGGSPRVPRGFPGGHLGEGPERLPRRPGGAGAEEF